MVEVAYIFEHSNGRHYGSTLKEQNETWLEEDDTIRRKCDDACPYFMRAPFDPAWGICVESKDSIEWVEASDEYDSWVCEW